MASLKQLQKEVAELKAEKAVNEFVKEQESDGVTVLENYLYENNPRIKLLTKNDSSIYAETYVLTPGMESPERITGINVDLEENGLQFKSRARNLGYFALGVAVGVLGLTFGLVI
jgi:hypothetical protein